VNGADGDVFTVLGAGGVIGSQLAAALRGRGLTVHTPGRDQPLTGPLGHVLFCIGVTADFRRRPWDTLDAHVGALTALLRRGNFSSLLYLSSARVYQRLDPDRPATEDAVLPVDVQDPGELYNLSKLAGEAACLAAASPTVRIARLANVYGGDRSSENFLATILRDAGERGHVHLQTALGSAKDYVSIADVIWALPRIAVSGGHRLYNVASGRTVSHREIVALLERHCGCTVSVAAGAPELRQPPVAITRLQREFGFCPAALDADFPSLVEPFRR
jgi:nucleoside-diphosphate-sugar epimerase